jgi:transposase InsO family protein
VIRSNIFSRYVVDWMVAPGESAELSEALVARATKGQGITPATLTIHADRGTSTTSKPVAELLADLGIGRNGLTLLLGPTRRTPVQGMLG